MQWTVYGIFFSEMIGYKTVIFFNFWRPFFFFTSFFFGIRQSATRLFILFNCYIHWVFIFLTSIFLFPRRYVTRLWQWRALPCHWLVAPWPSTTRSSAPPSPGNSSNRKWPPWAPKNDEVGIVCTGHILLCWGEMVQFCKRKFGRILMYKYLCELKLHTVGVGDDEVGDKWKYM